MIKQILATVAPATQAVLTATVTAAQRLFTHWRTLLLMVVLYAALLWVVYLFFGVVKEATVWDVFLSFLVLPLAALVLFFVLQGLGLGYTQDGALPFPLLMRAVRNAWKLLLASLPALFFAYFVTYLFTFLHPATTSEVTATSTAQLAREKLGWVLWCAAFLLVLPLWLIHAWMTATHAGLEAALALLGRRVVAVFSLRAVLAYGLLVTPCAALANFLFFSPAFVESDWTELWLFALRLGLAFLTILVGWLLLLGTLVELNCEKITEHMPPGAHSKHTSLEQGTVPRPSSASG